MRVPPMESWRVCSLLAALLAGPFVLPPSLATAASPFSRQPTNPSAEFRSSVSNARPNEALPKHVLAPPGELTLFADFQAADGNGVPLYLVNRTSTAVTPSNQGGDIYIKLEARTPEGEWKRAQSHLKSWCGDSYTVKVTLPAGTFFSFRGYRPKSGRKMTVRYASYGSSAPASNEGIGLINDQDLEAASLDRLATSGVPFPLVNLLYHDLRPLNDSKEALVDVIAALRFLQSYSDNPALKAGARQVAENVSASFTADSAQKTAATTILEILDSSWPKQTSTDALIQRCISSLRSQKKAGKTLFGPLEREQRLAWSVLADIASQDARVRGTPPFSARWQPVAKSISTLLLDSDVFVPESAALLLKVESFADEFLPDAFFEKCLFARQSYVQAACASVLSRRKKQSRLVDLGWALPPEGQRNVFLALANPPSSSRAPDSLKEEKFWEHVLHAHPFLGTEVNSEQLPKIVRPSMREHLLEEAKHTGRLKADFDLNDRRCPIWVATSKLALSPTPEDREVFEALLSYRGYQKFTRSYNGRSSTLYQFPIREIAQQALKKLGVTLKKEVELEKVIEGVP